MPDTEVDVSDNLLPKWWGNGLKITKVSQISFLVFLVNVAPYL